MNLKKICEKFLGICARYVVKRDAPCIIAVAGSVGKSSTKEAIGIVLGDGIIVSPKNYNTEIGVPLTIFGCDAPVGSAWRWAACICTSLCYVIRLYTLKSKTIVLEMGTDKPGDLKYILGIAPPHISVLTAISPEHMEFFGDIEAVAKEECEVLRAVRQDGVGIVNADDVLIQKYGDISAYSFGCAEQASVRILQTEIILDAEIPTHSGLDVTLYVNGENKKLRLKGMVGRPQAYAISAALAVAQAMKVEIDVAISRLQALYRGMPGRMTLVEGIKRTWLIDDTYNSSPLAALSAIRDLANFPKSSNGKKIAVLGDMLELGAMSDRAHIDEGRAIAEAEIDMLVVCGTLGGVVAKSAIEAGMSVDTVFTFASSAEAGRFVQTKLKMDDVVLVKGSRGMHMEKVIQELTAYPNI